jgi:hypothetical protein
MFMLALRLLLAILLIISAAFFNLFFEFDVVVIAAPD